MKNHSKWSKVGSLLLAMGLASMFTFGVTTISLNYYVANLQDQVQELEVDNLRLKNQVNSIKEHNALEKAYANRERTIESEVERFNKALP